MTRNIFFTLIILSLSFIANAQSNKPSDKMHKIVFQLSSDDTLVHKSLVRQLNNVLTAVPSATIEVVCHGPGINFLVTDKTIVHDKIQQLKTKGITFAACENTLKERNISKEKIIAEAFFCPVRPGRNND